jgi:PAS domain S-box-containing protein
MGEEAPVPAAPAPPPEGPRRLPRLRLGALLLALVLAVLVPAFAVGGYATWRALRTAEAAAEGRLLDTAGALALAVDREIGGQLAALTGFATSPAFGTGADALDTEALDAHARRIVAALGTNLSVLRRDGTRVVATALPPGAPLPPSAAPEAIARVFATGRPAVTDLVPAGAISGVPVVSLTLPVHDPQGQATFAVMAAFRVERLHDLLAAQGLPAGFFASIVDAGDTVVARSDALHARLVGQRASAEVRAQYAGRPSGVFRATTLDGARSVVAHHALSAAPGWRVFVAEPLASFAAAWRGPVLTLAAGGAATLLLGSGLALLAARGVLRPLRRLGGHAEALAAGGGGTTAAALPPAPVRELEVLRRGFAGAEVAVASREAERAASERRFRTIFESAAIGMARVAFAGERWIEVNDTFCRMLGRSREEVLDTPWTALTHPDDVELDLLAFRRMARGEIDSYAVEKRFLHAEGRHVWARLTLSLIRNEAGRPDYEIAVIEDITERREAEAALAAGERRLRAVLESTADGILSLGPDWRVTFLNRNAIRMIAGGRDILGQDLWDAFPEAVGGAFWVAFQHCLSERLPTEAEEHYPPLRRSFAVRAFPAEDGGITVFFQDVTERRDAEARLRASEERLRLALDAGRMGVFAWDFATDKLEWDDRQYELFGADRAAGEMTGKRALSLVHPEDRPALEASIQAAVEAGQGVFQYEFRVPLAGGSTRWISGHGRVVAGPDGRAERMVGLNFDTTAAGEVEAALARSNEEARIAAERVQLALSAGAIVGTWDWELPSDRFTVDERFAESFGLDPALGRTGLPLETVIATVHPEDVAGLRAAIAEAIARGGPYSHEYRVRGRDGAFRWIQANGRVDHAPDGTPLRFPGVLLDIEARRALEAERDRAAELLRAFADAVPGVVYAKDREGRMLVANHGATALIGKPRDFYLGRTDAEFLDDPVQAARVMENDRRIMERGVAEQVEEAVSRPDGTPAVWLSTKAPFRDAAGRVIGLIGASVDITSRKDAEAVLARSNEELERLVEARTAELRASEARLAEAARMEALGRLAGGIAHDFNNVLQAVQGGIALAAKRLTRDPNAARRFLDLAVDATERGAAVTGRLLAFARRGELSADAIAAAPLLDGLTQILSHTLGPGVTLAVEIRDATPPLLADAAQLESVLVNLANNARDALPGSVGTITLRAEPVTAAMAGAPAGLALGDYVRLSVVDGGEGMPPEVLARVTEPFFTTKPRGKGTGLGLAMARGFAEQSGGALVIESARGRGTTVALWMPRAPAHAAVANAAARRLAAQPERDARSAAVMLVDDEPGVRATVAAALADRGHRITEAEDAFGALARLDTGAAVEVLVTDLSMPGGMDGLALVREARRRRPGLPALLITGHAGEAAQGALQEAVGTGPFAVLRKPASAEAVGAQVAALLDAGGAAS